LQVVSDVSGSDQPGDLQDPKLKQVINERFDRFFKQRH